MSFGLPSVKSKPSFPDQFIFTEGSFGVPEVMTNGFVSAKSNVESGHPLMKSELNHRKNTDKMNMTILRNTQGLHAPLRIAMEQKAAKKIGHLPFLPSSNVMLESLTGRDIEIDTTDIYGQYESLEQVGLPHAVIERSLSIL